MNIAAEKRKTHIILDPSISRDVFLKFVTSVQKDKEKGNHLYRVGPN